MQKVEGGAEFPPETPLPPRPHFSWPFWEFRGQMQRVPGRKNEGAVADERVRTDFLEKRSDLGCVSAVCQNTGLFTVI